MLELPGQGPKQAIVLFVVYFKSISFIAEILEFRRKKKQKIFSKYPVIRN